VGDESLETALGGVDAVLSPWGLIDRPTTREGTLFLRSASTGGGGLDTFTAEEPIPLGAEVLYVEGSPPRLVASDRVSLDPETRDITVDRELVEAGGARPRSIPVLITRWCERCPESVPGPARSRDGR
jgi:hypothetical protein